MTMLLRRCVVLAVAAAFVIAVTPRVVVHAATQFQVNASDDAPDAHPGDGVCATAAGTCTLRAALQEAAPASGPVEVAVPAGTYAIGGEAVALGGAVTLTGAGAATTTVHITASRGFDLTGGSLHVSGLTLQGSNTAGAGAAVLRAQDSDVTLSNCVVSGAVADGDGGAILTSGGTLSLDHTQLRSNVGQSGGSVFALRSAISITSSTFDSDTATADGGAVFLSDPSSVHIADTTFTGNTASGKGGSIYLVGLAGGAGADNSITSSPFQGNVAFDAGGALYVQSTSDGTADAPLHVTSSTFSGNTASRGGAIASAAGVVSVEGSTFSNNRSASGDGGAIAGTGALTVQGSSFDHNTSDSSGGAIWAAGNADISGSNFTANAAATLGGALALTGQTVPSVRSLKLSANSAQDGQPDIWREGRALVTASGAHNSSAATKSAVSPVIVAAGAAVLTVALLAFVVLRRRSRDVTEPPARS